MVRAILTNSTLVSMGQAEAVISCPPKFAAGARQRLAEIATVFTRELGRAMEVRIQDVEGGTSAADGEGAAAAAGAPGGAAAPGQPGSPVEDPLVKLAAELFGARIVAVTQRPHPHH